jgi:hypothetical protein
MDFQNEIKNVLHYFILFCSLFNKSVSNSDDHEQWIVKVMKGNEEKHEKIVSAIGMPTGDSIQTPSE